MLRIMLSARDQLQEVVKIILEPSSAPEQSIDRIAELLECSPGDARRIYSTSLQSFDVQHQDRLSGELQEIEQELRKLDGDEPA